MCCGVVLAVGYPPAASAVVVGDLPHGVAHSARPFFFVRVSSGPASIPGLFRAA